MSSPNRRRSQSVMRRVARDAHRLPGRRSESRLITDESGFSPNRAPDRLGSPGNPTVAWLKLTFAKSDASHGDNISLA
jgi:hypothetical protein